ncbi:MAG: heparinase II/III family protein [Planctomycetia bacterium]|jgi:hypothetical protein
MKHSIFLTTLLLVLVVMMTMLTNPATAQQNSNRSLPGLAKKHPRLFLTPKRLKAIEKEAKSDATLAKLIELTKQNAEKMLTEPVVEYKIPDGKRLLGQSRKAIYRIWALALTYRLTEDRRFLDAAVKEMLTVAKFKDWNPSHFLDTAEMTAAVAVGYDWLHDAMDPKDRQTIREAIVRLGLEPGLKSFETKHWWTTTTSNWNQVCNGGMILGSLAVGDEEPELAGRMLNLCYKSIPAGLKAYQPDGAYPEGPSYWGYGTNYTVLTMLALDSAMGNDFNIHQSPGLASTATYRIHMEGPFRFLFNYADGSPINSPDFGVLGLAYIYNQPNIAQIHMATLEDHYRLKAEKMRRPKQRFFPLHVIYYPECKKLLKRPTKPLPLDACFRGKQDVVTMRGKWNDRDATFLAIKGGDNQANHGHLDIGSFVLDAGGRWASDLGADNYNMPGYFDRKNRRWTYYRMTNKSHNTLVIGDRLQNIKAVARVTDFRSTPKMATATIDMSDAYKGQADSVFRTATLLDRKRVVIEDTVTAPTAEVRWGMVTYAQITLDGSKATLKRGKSTMQVEILSPKGAQFQILSTKPNNPNNPKENPNKKTRMLAFTVKPDGKKPLTLKVAFTPE